MTGTQSALHVLRRQVDDAIGRREWPAAANALRQLLSHEPRSAALLVQLSYVESYCGRYRAARAAALQAAQQPPGNEEVAKDVLARLRTFNACTVLHDYIRRLGPPSRTPIRILLQAAAQLSYLNEQAAALALLDEARRGDPDFPGTLLSRAQVLIYLGRFDDARAELEGVLRINPGIVQTYWLMAQLGRHTRERNHTKQVRELLARPGMKQEDAAALGFALHRELDDLEDWPGAWSALEQACRTRRGMVAYQPEQSRRLVDTLVSLPATLPAGNPEGPVPVFITGMHRSGTTLLEQLLDGHPEIRGVGELYDFTSAMRYATDHHCQGVIDQAIVDRSQGIDFMAVGKWYLKGMEWRLGKERYFTDKLPSNFLNIGFICQALPQAKVLHMVRDPIETCFSNLRELFSNANLYSYDQLELADFYRQYRRLMAHWHRTYPGRILDVDYAELTRDTEAVLRRVSAFCGFEFEPEMLALQNRKRGVGTASAVQVRDKVVVREQPKWKPYEQYLQPLIQALRADGFVG